VQGEEEMERFLNKASFLFVEKFEKLKGERIEMEIREIGAGVEEHRRQYAALREERDSLKNEVQELRVLVKKAGQKSWLELTADERDPLWMTGDDEESDFT
jgi:uncharacterized coiled-coil DUF342 family protein